MAVREHVCCCECGESLYMIPGPMQGQRDRYTSPEKCEECGTHNAVDRHGNTRPISSSMAGWHRAWWWARWFLILPGAVLGTVIASAIGGCASYATPSDSLWMVESARMAFCGATWVTVAAVISPRGKRSTACLFFALLSAATGFAAAKTRAAFVEEWQIILWTLSLLIGAGLACGAGWRDEKFFTVEQWMGK